MNFRHLPHHMPCAVVLRFLSVVRGASTLLAALALCAANPAHAGLVTGKWDPAFGAFRPGLNWAIQGQFLVPNACSAQADGVYSTSAGACAGATTLSLDLRLFNSAADPDNFYESSAHSQVRTLHADSVGANGGYLISQVRVVDGQVVGFVAGYMGLTESPIHQGFVDPGETQGNAYGAWLDLLGARVECFQCGDDEISVIGDRAGLTQVLETYDSDDTSAPKFTDADGKPLRAVLDEEGNYVGRFPSDSAQVPEPGALALVLTALVAAGGASRARRIRGRHRGRHRS